LIESRGDLITLEKDNTRLISKNYEDILKEPQKVERTKYKPIWTFGAGLVFPQGNRHFNGGNPKSAGDYKTGISLFAGYVIPLKPFCAFKGEIDYSRIPNGDNYYYSSYMNDSYTTHQTGGNINEATVRAGLGIGNFNTEDKIIIDAFLSLGAGVIFKDATTLYEKYTGASPRESVYTETAFSESLFCFNLNISVKYKIGRNAGFFIEPQTGVYSSLNAPFQVVLKAGAFF
ncbi:MAG: hypothetical protein LWX07_10305, partial [Bacteroidetes bacterium]|nr:hypothetical protein [Bacteroidota bacterium]